MAHIIPQLPIAPDENCFEEYVGKSRKSFNSRLPAALAEAEEVMLRDRIGNLSEQIDEFLVSDLNSRAWLVLGKVQSGKTSHLLGMVSWAATREFALASLFTGNNNALNNQGKDRIQSDLSKACVRVFEVPTSVNGPAFQNLKEDLHALIKERKSPRLPGLEYPLPVLVTLKNPGRVETLARLLSDLQKEFVDALPYLMIDDEADQASQNGKAQRLEVTKTYAAIAALRESGIKHCLLAYTATPQAVLLSEREGLLRPDRCVTVPPKSGYFGLDEFMQESFQKNLIPVLDVDSRASDLRTAPESLKEAFLGFMLATYVRTDFPEVFYAGTVAADLGQIRRMQSTQFMIHESSANKDQSAMFDLFREVKSSLTAQLRDYLHSGLSDFLENGWQGVRARAESSGQFLPEVLDTQAIKRLINMVQQNKTLVVNADSLSPTAGEPFPVKDSEWEVHSNWTLIGGDILGRGLTIPQLVTSYFLRTSAKPNFDTVSQQMRFCGYRGDYAHFTTIFAHPETFDLFRYMQKIEEVVWRHASKWDRNRTSLTGKIPPIMYAAPTSANLEPTRRAVRDPNLRDTKISDSSEILYSARHVFNPSHVYQNIKSIRDWYSNTQADGQDVKGDWISLSDLPLKDLQSLIPTLITAENNKQEMRAIAELFDGSMGELGLANRPASVLLKAPLIKDDRIFVDPRSYWDACSIHRGISRAVDGVDLETWVSSYGPAGNTRTWGSLQSPHVGDTQRNLVKNLPFEGSVLLLEPVSGTSNKVVTALGIAITIFKPKDFEVRMIGHA